MQTGNQVTGRPCLGSWASYGLGSENDNLPTFVVMVASPQILNKFKPFRRGCGRADTFLASMLEFLSVSAGDPILYINNPPGVSREVRRTTLDA